MLIPKRIISVVPSQTELLFDIGLDEEVIGITKFCIHPNNWFRSKQRIGGTKNLNLKLIEKLNPDLILANKEENEKSQIDYLSEKYPVWTSDIQTFEDALDMIQSIGMLTGKIKESLSICNKIKQHKSSSELGKLNKKVLYLIWKSPYMAAGVDTFIHEMLSIAGFDNAVTATRYPSLTFEGIQKINPDIVFLSSEPFPFKEKHIYEMQNSLPNAKIKLVDGELFSWYGSRMLKSFVYFRALHEELV